ncbi:hypothetical protein GUJ93_ZPchr0008g12176 [Zizania palustris]|uniref:Uncharacterized protein n=1 Tax=Zizania palustris TaxID=103762 RepID=A0A8J5V0T1_ZIZPA|nr:hypothetical protein GUJ93_ZPchr0008g12176 [Zizania palustris]KAG8045331.1 hypothetical protein GUJ93_ZPchr0008g12176 [Zizania palustris]
MDVGVHIISLGHLHPHVVTLPSLFCACRRGSSVSRCASPPPGDLHTPLPYHCPLVPPILPLLPALASPAWNSASCPASQPLPLSFHFSALSSPPLPYFELELGKENKGVQPAPGWAGRSAPPVLSLQESPDPNTRTSYTEKWRYCI